MKQINFKITDLDDFSKALTSVSALDEYKSASDIIALAVIGSGDEDFARQMIGLWEERDLKGKMIGFTSPSCVLDGVNLKQQTILSFSIFESSYADVYFYDGSAGHLKEDADEFSQAIQESEYVKGVEIFVNSEGKSDSEEFFSNVKIDTNEIPISGASIGNFDLVEASGETFLFAQGQILKDGLIGIIFRGKELFIHAEREMGWAPIGSKHTVTKMAGPRTVAEIDGIPVSDFYTKYLGLSDDKFFNANAKDFPWFLRREGTDLLFSPTGRDNAKNLTFAFPLYEGEQFNFAFGSMRRILSNSERFARRLVLFHPQGIYMTVSHYRQSCMGFDQQTETDLFSYLCPTVAGYGTSSEVTFSGGKTNQMNCAVIVVAMREGSPAKARGTSGFNIPSSQRSGPSPLVDRLYNFLKVTTEEFSELREASSKASIGILSKSYREILQPLEYLIAQNQKILSKSADTEITQASQNIAEAGSKISSILRSLSELTKESQKSTGKTDISQNPFLQSLSKIKGLSVTAGIANCGDEEAYADIIKIFADSPDDSPDVLQGYFDSENWTDYTVKVHSLKSSARLLGAAELSAEAAYLEQCGNEGRIDEIKKKNPDLMKDFRAIVDAILEAEASLKPSLSESEIKSAWDAIGEFIKAKDFAAANNVISDLNGYKIPAEDKKLLTELVKELENKNEERIKAILGEKK